MWVKIDLGIINDVQHRIAKKRKRLGNIYLGYDESYEFKSLERNTLSSIFYSKQFYLYESMVKEGWSIRILVKKRTKDTVHLVQYLQDVLDDFAKKLIVLLNISDLIPIYP
jgi:DNA polymerase-3 subunit alpha